MTDIIEEMIAKRINHYKQRQTTMQSYFAMWHLEWTLERVRKDPNFKAWVATAILEGNEKKRKQFKMDAILMDYYRISLHQ